MERGKLAKVLIIGGVIAAFVLTFALRGGEGPAVNAGADAVAAYDEAIATGKPVYVLFHSSACAPCTEASQIAARVMPEYADRIEFVPALTDSPSGAALAQRFSFQFVPTSFFIGADGEIADSAEGVIRDADIRARLDALAGQ